MSIMLAKSWRWKPKVIKVTYPDAPYSTIIHAFCWLIFLGKRK